MKPSDVRNRCTSHATSAVDVLAIILDELAGGAHLDEKRQLVALLDQALKARFCEDVTDDTIAEHLGESVPNRTPSGQAMRAAISMLTTVRMKHRTR